MKLSFTVKTDIESEKVTRLVDEASREGLRDTIVAMHNDAVRGSPVLTGHNRRSITSEVSKMGVVHQGADSKPDKIVNDSKIEGAFYSTSGYGGYLETGTTNRSGGVKMAPRPYFRPAYDMNIGGLDDAIAKRLAAK